MTKEMHSVTVCLPVMFDQNDNIVWVDKVFHFESLSAAKTFCNEMQRRPEIEHVILESVRLRDTSDAITLSLSIVKMLDAFGLDALKEKKHEPQN